MSNQFRNLEIEAPQFCAEGLMRELSGFGAFVQGMANKPSLHIVHVAIPSNHVGALEAWLSVASNGVGRIVGNEPAKDA